eukprot:gene16984-693_t
MLRTAAIKRTAANPRAADPHRPARLPVLFLRRLRGGAVRTGPEHPAGAGRVVWASAWRRRQRCDGDFNETEYMSVKRWCKAFQGDKPYLSNGKERWCVSKIYRWGVVRAVNDFAREKQ